MKFCPLALSYTIFFFIFISKTNFFLQLFSFKFCVKIKIPKNCSKMEPNRKAPGGEHVSGQMLKLADVALVVLSLSFFYGYSASFFFFCFVWFSVNFSHYTHFLTISHISVTFLSHFLHFMLF